MAAILNLQGLEQFRASALLDGHPIDASTPGRVLLDLIDFDPEQPRRSVDETALAELASSIREVGVLEPVSLRPHPGAAGRFIVNRGERRVRAARLAGLSDIPFFLDIRIDPYAQVIENLQREDLSPFDLARFIAQREARGDSRATIARRLHKSASFITEVAGLCTAPPEVRAAFDSGRVRDTRVLYQLARSLQANPAAADVLASAEGPITRGSLSRRIVPQADERRTDAAGADADAERGGKIGAETGQKSSSRSADALLVEHSGRRGRLGLSGWPGRRTGEVRFDDGTRQVLELSDLKLLSWTVR